MVVKFGRNFFCMYILMKRDVCPKLFLLCQMCGFMCNNKSLNKLKISKMENYVFQTKRSKTLSQIQVERMPQVPGLNPTQDFGIDLSELEFYLLLFLIYLWLHLTIWLFNIRPEELWSLSYLPTIQATLLPGKSRFKDSLQQQKLTKIM